MTLQHKEDFIFITNDDGVAARGLKAIVEVASRYAYTLVIAPETSQSGMAHAITMYSPLYLREVERGDNFEIWACTGTPVDCVKMGYDHFFAGRRPLLNISGINHGSNSAISVLYSGTMGAAIEASFYGAPSFGLSLTDHSDSADFAASAAFADRFIPQMLRCRFDEPLCLNINVPVCEPQAIKGVKICRQNRGYWQEEFYCRTDPRGKEYFWLTGDFLNQEPEACDTDEWALAHNYISIVPVSVDMTNYKQFDTVDRILGNCSDDFR